VHVVAAAIVALVGASAQVGAVDEVTGFSMSVRAFRSPTERARISRDAALRHSHRPASEAR